MVSPWKAVLKGRAWRGGLAAMVMCGLLAACADDAKQPQIPGEAAAGTWHTWILKAPTDVAVPAPPAKGSSEAKADNEAAKKAANDRTREDLDLIRMYDPTLPTDPWMKLAFEYVSKSEKNPPLSSRNYGLVAIAMNDAMVAAYHYMYEFDVPAPSGVKPAFPLPNEPAYPSVHAAMAGAASKVLAHLYPNQPALRLDEMADEAGRSRVLAGAATPKAVDAGLALGRGVAEKVIEYAKADGSDAVWNGRRPTGIANTTAFWQPPPGSVSPPVAPVAGTWKTFTLTKPDQFRPPAPPAFNSAEFRASAQRLLDVQKNLTEEQKRIAKFWEGAEGTALPAGIVNDVYAEDLRAAANVADVTKRATLPWLVRAVTMLNVAMSDGGISVWDAKFTYWNPRPENGIRDSGVDRNFKPFLPTPRFPAYPSGSAGYAGAAEAVMTYLFPDKAAEFKRRADEQAVSRQYAGIHWDYDTASMEGGRGIGQLVIDKVKGDQLVNSAT